jgi:NAD(P)-dependent dehydrogenase (short-subunit alcohol dehydrogenase family)
MGRDISVQLAAHGADVLMVARSDRHLPAVAAEIEALGRRAIQVHADVTAAPDRARLADAVAEHFDGLDILVNSAFHSGRIEPFATADLEKWQRPMDVNLWGTLGVTQALLEPLRRAGRERGDAAVVMINTMSVQLVARNFGSYVASKSALAGVTKTLAQELGAEHIRVNSIHPGYIWGPTVKTYFDFLATERGGGVTWETIFEEHSADVALGYLPHSEEIAGSVVYLSSPLARCVTGVAIPVNGGHWIPPVS